MVSVVPEEKLKHQQVYDRLVEELSNSGFQIGERLPSERDFALMLNVNIATVRRAFRQLVLGGIVEKRSGSGTYLLQHFDSDWHSRPVNLILDQYNSSPIQNQLSFLAQKVAQRNSRQCRVIYTTTENMSDLLQSCLTYRQPTVIGGEVPDLDILKAAPELFVSMSSMLYLEGIPTVRCDDALGTSMLMTHLQELGHRRIAFLCTGTHGRGLEDFQMTAWSSALGTDYTPELKITLSENQYSDDSHNAFHSMRKVLPHSDFTALICLHDAMMLGAVAALRDLGKRIPEDVSVVSIGNSSMSAYAAPPVTCIDPNLEAHLEMAMQMLDYNYSHPERIDTLRLVRPEFILRSSTGPAPAKG